jgi:tetratricopeptide (TPR) repeat protein
MSGANPAAAVKPVLAQGWQVLGRDPKAAQRVAEQVLGAAPGLPDAVLLVAAALRRQNALEPAYARLEPLMAKQPRNAIAWFEWGMVLAGVGEERRGIEALRRAVTLEPGFTAAWRGLGDACLVLGLGSAAGEAYAHAAQAASQDPRLASAAAALADGRVAAAESLLLTHVRHHPGDLRAMHLLGEAALRLGRLAEAQAVLEECLSRVPGFADVRHSLAVLLYTQRKFADAAPHFRHLLALAPFHASLRVLLWVCLVETGDYAAALPLYETSLAVSRNQPNVWLLYAHALKTLGREADAAAAYRACIALAPHWSAGAYLSLADLKTVPFTAEEIAAMTEWAGKPGVPEADAAKLHYALGRARESSGEHDAAFRHFATGARLRRAGITYDPAALTACVAASTSLFTPEFFAAHAGSGCAADAPIFVVGMPRSGSTLVEQILASHSAVEGAGELRVLGEIAAGLQGGQPMAALPEIIAGLDAVALARLGERYMDETRQFRLQGRPRFIDKMPDNFRHAGLIRLILPNAKIVDVRRSAMAAGFAAFKQYFQDRQTGQDYTYDLAEIAAYRRDYVALMAHYDAVQPGRIHLVQYERLVTDNEAEIGRLLAACGLAPEPGCLRWWETARAVQTPSAQQVRRPVFREGLDHWRCYEAWLTPLRHALGPLAETG